MQLLAMKNFLVKLKYKSQQDEEPSNSSNGKISLNRKLVACHDYPLIDKHLNTKMTLEARVSEGITPTSPMSDVVVSPCGGLSGSPASGVIVLGAKATTVSAATSLGEYTMPERNYWQGKHSLFNYFRPLLPLPVEVAVCECMENRN